MRKSSVRRIQVAASFLVATAVITGLVVITPGSVPEAPAPEIALRPVVAAAPAAPELLVRFSVTGTSRVAKLGSDIPVGPGTFDAYLDSSGMTPDGRIPLKGDLTLPPSSAYLVVFRFMPVTNTVTFTPPARATGTTTLDLVKLTSDVDITVPLTLRLSEVKQDGVPLDVGPDCRTESPLVVPIKGTLSLKTGDTTELVSTFDIPRFSGCGVREDLDPLLTGLVSGPGNTMTSRLSPICIGCPIGQEG